MHRAAVGTGDDEVLVGVAGTKRDAFLELAAPVLAQRSHGRRVKGHTSPAFRGLRRAPGDAWLALAARISRDQRSDDTKRPRGQLDVRPSKPECLAAAHPRCREQPPCAGQPILGDAREESAELARRPGLHLGSRRGPRRIGRIGGVANDRLPADRIAKRPVHDCGDVANRSGRQRTVRVVAREQRRVEVVEVKRLHLLKGQRADAATGDVQPNVTSV